MHVLRLRITCVGVLPVATPQRNTMHCHQLQRPVHFVSMMPPNLCMCPAATKKHAMTRSWRHAGNYDSTQGCSRFVIPCADGTDYEECRGGDGRGPDGYVDLVCTDNNTCQPADESLRGVYDDQVSINFNAEQPDTRIVPAQTPFGARTCLTVVHRLV
jgi:hypothetical protein